MEDDNITVSNNSAHDQTAQIENVEQITSSINIKEEAFDDNTSQEDQAVSLPLECDDDAEVELNESTTSEIYRCPYCRYTSTEELALRKHQALTDHYVKTPVCPLCKMCRFKHHTNFEQHILLKHCEEAEEVVLLEKKRIQHGYHKIKLVKMKGLAIEVNIYSCLYCSFNTTDASTMEKHSKRMSILKKMNENGEWIDNIYVQKCSKCDYRCCQKFFNHKCT